MKHFVLLSCSIYMLVYLSVTVAGKVQLIIANNCDTELWPGIIGNFGQPTPKDGGFNLSSGHQVIIDIPEKWAGRVWGRQGCKFDKEGKGQCDTGDCSSKLRCQDTSGAPPATVVEMTFGSSSSPLHYYDVSLVDGFNLPVSMKPAGGGIGCGVATCDADLNVVCPSALEVKKGDRVVGCKSACLAMQSAKYCCTGKFDDAKTCKPTVLTNLFKALCPKAYTYAYDDSLTLKRCRAPRYVITFCPPSLF